MDPRTPIDGVQAKKLTGSPSKKRKQTQDALATYVGNSSSTEGHTDHASPLKKQSNAVDSADSELPSLDVDDNDDDYIDENDDQDFDGSYYDSFYEDTSEPDAYQSIQHQFDRVDFPSGVEASFSWFTGLSADETGTETKALTSSNLPGTETKESGLTAHADSSSESDGEVEGSQVNGVISTSTLDMVDSFIDHHYDTEGFKDTQPPKNWAKKIQKEWKILKDNLPETIFVKVCEARMELMRAVIIGPSGTPYHDGLFVFDCLFPTDYPNSPPSMYYYSGGVRLNPNLYDCGKVCLSLLGTWEGRKTENWMPGKSTMLQVLVSIQALILNMRPFFNEPGHEHYAGPEGELKSRMYNENAFFLCLKTMIYTLRKPPKHFEDFTVQHFRDRAHHILSACKAYVEGTMVGGFTGESTLHHEDRNESDKGFKSAVASVMGLLIECFSKIGTPNCEEFQISTVQPSDDVDYVSE